MSNSKDLTRDGVTYTFQHVPGHGRCLVPLQHRIKPEDIIAGRKYYNLAGVKQIIRTIRLTDSGVQTYMIGPANGDYHYNRCAWTDTKELIECILSGNRDQMTSFEDWCAEDA